MVQIPKYMNFNEDKCILLQMKPEIDENFSIIAVNNECFIVQQLYSLHFCNNHVTDGQSKFCIVGYCSDESLTIKYSAVNVNSWKRKI